MSELSGKSALPEGPLVAWYGDDFTGAAAVMEVLEFAGLPSVLFLEQPDEALLARFSGYRGVGLAGTARAQSPEWMNDHLPAIYQFLKSVGAGLCHYKVCSTLDSSPEIGSIGRAMDHAMEAFGASALACLVAAPPMQRYQTFGNLFAAAPGEIARLDRHPVMKQHPVTPMDEADVRQHLARQTELTMGLIDLVDLANPEGAVSALAREEARRAQVLAVDSVDVITLANAGNFMWDGRDDLKIVFGSQGVEYALTEYWRRAGLLEVPEGADQLVSAKGVGASQQIAVVCGSVSSVTKRQIGWAEQNGFSLIKLEADKLLGAGRDAEIARASGAAMDAVSKAQSPLIYSARGADDPAVKRFTIAATEAGMGLSQANEILGRALGEVLQRVLKETGITRAVIAGGDTSGYASSQLDIVALRALAPTIPGAALCQAFPRDQTEPTFELALKGGQMGSDDYFGWIRSGGGERAGGGKRAGGKRE